MLKIRIEGSEFFDEVKEEFIILPDQNLVLEHSLLSISKWEAKWKKPFLDTKLTMNEFIDYIRCMTVNSQVNPLVYNQLTDHHLKAIQAYMEDSKTATTIKNNRRRSSRGRNTTSELIYCWMFSLNIPIDCEKWHINRLLMLIDVCSIENNPKSRKMSQRDIHRQNAALNAARRAKYNTRG